MPLLAMWPCVLAGAAAAALGSRLQPRPHWPVRLPCRRTRGDGNCFFRSFLFGYLEVRWAGLG